MSGPERDAVGPDAAAEHGLTDAEFARIVSILGRRPNLVELGIFSVMWSEHCSYKSSRVHLARLPTRGPAVLQGPGENAGAIAIDDELAAVFKIESHNHPSFIEPYQGAATGVGGIIRDIFTMGARPIALLDSLRFGPLDEPLARRLLEGVVAGIAGYGNSIGIPTVGGEVAFDESYAGNPLVNVFCLGVVRRTDLIRGRAEGVGNSVYYVGAKTGRDGIHGATMASSEFDEASSEKRPNVQVGDPFLEKLLLEACLEALRSDTIVGLQDMGAAGLTCSACEMGARGGVGIEMDIAQVPQREAGMTPYEIMLSESQERMLFIVRRGGEAEVERIFRKWDLDAVRIGTVTGDGLLRVRNGGETVAEIPNRPLADEAPRYDRPVRAPEDLADRQRLDLDALRARPAPAPAEALLQLLASPAVASTRWISRQYDHMVRTNTLVPPGRGAGVVRIKGTRRALAFALDGNGRYCRLDPYRGALLAVAESARNVACAGARPVAATNCLNFGNPERPEIMWEFARAVEGLGDACRALGVPITGGNVSLYNETAGRAILPTPVLGVVGILDDAERALAGVFRRPGAAVVLLGAPGAPTLGGSEYLKRFHGLTRGRPPAIDLAAEAALERLVADLAADGLLESAHDCAEGGLAVTVAECCFESGGIGAEIALPRPAGDGAVEQATALFGEAASLVVVSAAGDGAGAVLERARAAGVPAQAIGRTGGSRLRIGAGAAAGAGAGGVLVDLPLAEAEHAWATGLSRYWEPSAA